MCNKLTMSTSFLSAMNTRADDLYNMRCELGYAQCVVCNTWYPQLDMNYDDDTGFHTCVECDEDDELCEFCGDTDDCLMMCEGCKKSGCTECVKSYIGKYFGDCKECYEKQDFIDEDDVKQTFYYYRPHITEEEIINLHPLIINCKDVGVKYRTNYTLVYYCGGELFLTEA